LSKINLANLNAALPVQKIAGILHQCYKIWRFFSISDMMFAKFAEVEKISELHIIEMKFVQFFGLVKQHLHWQINVGHSTIPCSGPNVIKLFCP
jgi:hypothetical protein